MHTRDFAKSMAKLEKLGNCKIKPDKYVIARLTDIRHWLWHDITRTDVEMHSKWMRAIAELMMYGNVPIKAAWANGGDITMLLDYIPGVTCGSDMNACRLLYGGDISKLTSLLASDATAFMHDICECQHATFTCKIVQCPNLDAVFDYFVARQELSRVRVITALAAEQRRREANISLKEANEQVNRFTAQERFAIADHANMFDCVLPECLTGYMLFCNRFTVDKLYAGDLVTCDRRSILARRGLPTGGKFYDWLHLAFHDYAKAGVYSE